MGRSRPRAGGAQSPATLRKAQTGTRLSVRVRGSEGLDPALGWSEVCAALCACLRFLTR